MVKKRKGMKIALICIAVAVIAMIIFLLIIGAPVAWFIFSLSRNDRIAREVIQPKAEAYIAEAYPDTDFVLGEAYYGFKRMDYWVEVSSPSSKDTYFELSFNEDTYELCEDTYKTAVLGGHNTRDRLIEEYSLLVEDCLASIDGFYRLSSDFCRYSEKSTSDTYFSPDGLDASTLILDHEYDVAVMGGEYGTLELVIISPVEEIDPEGAYKLLLEIDRRLTEKGIGYAWLEVTLQDAAYPNAEVKFHIYDVSPEDLHRDNALSRLQELWDAQEKTRQEVKAQRESDE